LPSVSFLYETATDGSALGLIPNHGLRLRRELRERHLLAIGTTGAGKTQKVILPQLAADVADTDRAMIVLDAKGGVLYGYLTELARRHRPGQKVRLVNLRSAARNELVWNPAWKIATRAESLEIAHAVCNNADVGAGGRTSTNETFWLFSSINLLADVLRLLADDPREKASLARAKDVIDNDSYGLASVADNHPYTKQFSKRYPAVVRVLEGSSHVTQQSIVADLAMRMLLFGDEDIAHTTSGPNQLDFSQVLREGGILVLEVPEAHARQLIPLTNLFVTRLFSVLLQESMNSPDSRLPRPCSVVLDELGSACGKLPDFDVRLSTLRSRGVSVTGAVQTLAQIDHLYGTAARGVLDGFCTRLFFGGGLGQADAKLASEMSGTCTAASVSVMRTREAGRRSVVCRTTSPVPRAVMLPEEIARPTPHPLLGTPVTMFIPDRDPIQAYFPMAFELPALSECLRLGVEIEKQLRDRATEEGVRQEIDALKEQLRWCTLKGQAQAWWQKREANTESLRALLRGLAEEASRAPGVNLLKEMHRASRRCRSEEVETMLAYLRYWLMVRKSKAKAREERCPK
jgi:type IV secretory pathway TraG/TraD family ATPase VirD4